jgi:hypothetical protein
MVKSFLPLPDAVLTGVRLKSYVLAGIDGKEFPTCMDHT